MQIEQPVIRMQVTGLAARPGSASPLASEPVDAVDLDTAARVLKDPDFLKRPRTDWLFHGGGWMYEPTVGDDRTVYVGCGDDHLYAFNPDGTVKWKADTGLVLRAPTTGPDHTLYTGNTDGVLFALDERDGRERWRFETAYGEVGEVAVGADGTLYFGSGDNHVWAVNADGTEKWRFGTKGSVIARPLVTEDGHVYVGDQFGVLHALDANGQEIWSRETCEAFESPVALGKDGSIVMTRWKSVEALNPASGVPRWTREAACSRDAGPAVDEHGHIFVASHNGTMRVLDANGDEVHRSQVEGALVTTPRLGDDGSVVVRAMDRRVWSFGHDAGVRWSQKMPDAVVGASILSAPAVGPDGTVYVGNNDGTLTALHLQPLSEKLEESRIARGQDPSIERGEEWVIIGGVRVPVRRDPATPQPLGEEPLEGVRENART